jgi:DNA-binding transcriptional regulator LsrR (DeoR family)
VVQQFFDRLHRAPEARRQLQEKAWEIYPSHFFDEERFTNVHPLAQVATCAVMLLVHLAPTGDIKPIMFGLPPRFYSRPTKARTQFLQQNPHFWHSIRQAEAAEIALVGVGNLWGENGHLQKRYAVVLQRLDPKFESTGEEYVAESDFIPLRADGTVHRCIANKLVGIGIKGFRDMLKRSEPPIIIAVAGGKHKQRAVAAALVKPYFNVLVTDEAVAGYLLQERG